VVRKMILRQWIVLQPKEIVYIRVDYISLSKGCSFMMIAIYPAVSNVILDFDTPQIVIFVNPIAKLLKISKGIRLNTIYKYVDVAYIFTDAIRAFAALATALPIASEPFSTA